MVLHFILTVNSLLDVMELTLVWYKILLRCASVGYASTRMYVNAIVQKACNSKQLDVHVTHGCWESYCKCHPDLR